MVRADALTKIRATVEAILEDESAEVVEMSLRREGGGLVLRITVDGIEGRNPLSLDEITGLSEQISRALDIEDPIDARYTLEVSSAGLERPLVKPADFVRFLGKEIKVKTLDLIGEQKVFKGTIESAEKDDFELKVKGGELVRIPYEVVGNAKLVVDWDKELRRAT